MTGPSENRMQFLTVGWLEPFLQLWLWVLRMCGHPEDVWPPGACGPAARPHCRLPSASTPLTTAAHAILQLRNQMHWLKEEQGRKVYLESTKSLQAQMFQPQHKSCLVQAEMVPSRCRAVLWKTRLHSHSSLSLTDLWKSPVAALFVVHRSVFNYIFTVCQVLWWQHLRGCNSLACTPLSPQTPEEHRRAEQSLWKRPGPLV